MIDEEKNNLVRELKLLGLGDIPKHIVDFLRGDGSNESQIGEDEIEIDIDALSDRTLFTTQKLLDDYLQEKQTNHTKAEPYEMEPLNRLGLSNSSMQPCKGNDLVEEDVDISGNGPPVSSYSPVEIEKDEIHRNSKCSSSSSSSGKSGSSSSDSDSGSSSGNESGGIKASTPVNTLKVQETVVSEADLDQKRSGLGNPRYRNKSVSGLGQHEPNSQPRPTSVEADSHQEGGSGPSERQVSPEKLYWAALLRNRFANTIIKAREKALDQGEKRDPEKLRRERKELDRQQREEKARLQTEAKAAEDARRQAEAEAAAEAKRKRDLEREAARRALLKMEKTVEINENCQFLEDLKMLRAAPAEHVPPDSPDHLQDVLGSFNLWGNSIPLEQLGLYMKVDDDEEEEGQPHSVPDPVNDVDEGEID